MSVITVAPFVLKDVSLKIDVDNYEHHVSQVEFVPTQNTVTWKGLNPAAVFTDSGAPTWVCTLAYAQDWETADSLSQYLMDHAGEKVTATFAPLGAAAGQAFFTADIILAPGNIGGTVDGVAVATVSLGVDGVPVRGVAP
jgi:hypothetical protein